ncbi:MAG: hypothetical protein JWM27_4786 [Gemmatimonadetes bacterium]|nr:hypothetical protein [Gemmatimonadota bacterium]
MNQKPARISLENLEVESFDLSPQGPLFTWIQVQTDQISCLDTECACSFTCYGCWG